jgi:hypothetical protein
MAGFHQSSNETVGWVSCQEEGRPAPYLLSSTAEDIATTPPLALLLLVGGDPGTDETAFDSGGGTAPIAGAGFDLEEPGEIVCCVGYPNSAMPFARRLVSINRFVAINN